MYDDELAFAHGLADAAARIALDLFADDGLEIRHKADKTLVTAADTGIERMVRDRLATMFPGDRIMGEEEGGTWDGAGRVWIVDPIDGTANFARAIPVWATLIALQVDGEIVLGLANAPAMGERYAAVRGGGATMNGKRIRVSQTARMGDAQFLYSQLDTLLASTRNQAVVGLVVDSARERGFGDYWGHLLVARGAAEICLEPSLAIWDYAALVPIVEEAGGRVTNFEGGPPSHKGPVLSTNGALHDEVLRRLGDVSIRR
jgi:histidinol-phosphatase